MRDLGFCGALINGVTEGRFLDDPRFEPILARAEAARRADLFAPESAAARRSATPITAACRAKTGFRLSTAAWGWHSETAIHVLRLVLSGALDRHPKLKLIIGHMGEGLAAMMVRSDKISHARGAAPRNVRSSRRSSIRSAVTTSGMFTLAAARGACLRLRRRPGDVLDRLSLQHQSDWPGFPRHAQVAGWRSGKICARQCRPAAQAQERHGKK